MLRAVLRADAAAGFELLDQAGGSVAADFELALEDGGGALRPVLLWDKFIEIFTFSGTNPLCYYGISLLKFSPYYGTIEVKYRLLDYL